MSNNTKPFSVLLCVYGKDNAEHFQIAVNSILDQTVRPAQVVLVVDGPVPPELDQVIQRYETEPVFQVIRLEVNQGHGIARRTGLEACSNDLVAVMDADDISVNDRFEKQLAAFDADPSLDIVGGIITEFIHETENTAGRREVFPNDDQIKEDMKKRCPMNLVTVMFRKSSVEKAGGFVDWYCEEDYYLWLRMVQADMRFGNVADNLVFVRVGEEMYQRRGGWKYFTSEARLQKWMLQHRVIGFSTYVVNVAKRLIVQVLLPNRLRSWVFRKFARKQA